MLFDIAAEFCEGGGPKSTTSPYELVTCLPFPQMFSPDEGLNPINVSQLQKPESTLSVSH